MENFKSNSNASKAHTEKKVVKKVTYGNVSIRKQPITKRLAGTFFGENLSSAFEYVVSDIIVPTIKDTMYNIISGGLSTMLYGRNVSRGGLGGTKYKYSTSSVRGNTNISQPTNNYRPANDIEEIVFESRGDAEIVLDTLRNLIEEYEWATVQDLYSAAGKTPARNNWTTVNWGWDTLAKAYVEGIIGGGYIINLPHPKPDK